MTKTEKLEHILCQLDEMYRELKSLKVSSSCLAGLESACTEVELEIREIVEEFDIV